MITILMKMMKCSKQLIITIPGFLSGATLDLWQVHFPTIIGQSQNHHKDFFKSRIMTGQDNTLLLDYLLSTI